MTEKNQLDQSSGGSNKPGDSETDPPGTIPGKSSDQEEIIDLTELAAEESGSDEGIIDLIEELEPDARMEDDIIDLDKIVAEEPEPEDDFAGLFEEEGLEADSRAGMENGVIDLIDVAVDKTETDDDIIDLLDAVETDLDIGEDIIDFAEIADDFNDRDTTSDDRVVQQSGNFDNDFVDSLGMELTSVSEEDPSSLDTDLTNGETMEGAGIAMDLEGTSLPLESLDRDTAQKDIPQTQTSELTPQDFPRIPTDQLEEILKRIVDEMFSEKIEQMLATFIEKAVAREIERLKEILLENSPGN